MTSDSEMDRAKERRASGISKRRIQFRPQGTDPEQSLNGPAAEPEARPLQEQPQYDEGIPQDSRPASLHVGLQWMASLWLVRLRGATRF